MVHKTNFEKRLVKEEKEYDKWYVQQHTDYELILEEKGLNKQIKELNDIKKIYEKEIKRRKLKEIKIKPEDLKYL